MYFYPLIEQRLLLLNGLPLESKNLLLMNKLAEIVDYSTSPPGLPYITYTGMCRQTGSWFWYPFQRPFLERGIKIVDHGFIFCLKLLLIMNGVSVLGRILERGIKNWPFLEQGIPGGTYPPKKYPSAPPPLPPGP